MSAWRRPVRGNGDAGAVSAAAALLEDDDDSGDVVKVDYRFSILAVRRRLVDQLSEEQKEVVRSIGFDGVLHLTRYNKLDRHFAAWLCNQLELGTAAAAAPGASSSARAAPLFLKDGAGTKVPVTARDVHEVIGVPNGERQVGIGRNSTEKESDAAAVRRALGLDPGQAPTLQLAEAIIAGRGKDAPSRGPMTQPERDAFVVAFLLLLVEHFLAPGAPVGRRTKVKVNEEVFHALANPSEVRLYDWAEYVLEEFRRCAASVRQQLTASWCPKISISGCLLFLQIFYLDQFREVARDGLPRIAAYDYNSICSAIDLDRQPQWREGGLKQFGKLKFAVKHSAQTDGFGSTSKGQPSLHSCDSEYHDSTKNTDMPSSVHDATEGTDRVNIYSGNTAPRLQAEFRPKDVLSNQQPVTQRGVPSKKRNRSNFCDMPKEASPCTEKKAAGQMSSCQTTSDSSDDCVITYSFHPKSAAPRVDSRSNPKGIFSNLHPRTKQEVPSEKISQTEFESREGTQCHNYQNKFAAASSCPEEKPVTQGTACQTTPEDDVMILNYNPFESDTACTPSCNGPKMKKEYIFGRSPFEMGLVHPKPPKQAEACFKWLEACSYQDDQLNWTWVILEEPHSIAVNGGHIKLQMIRGAVLKQDVCNLVMHLYRQLDDEIYQNSGNAEPRWRHFLPAEWSSSALQLGDKICEPSPTVRSMFTGAHIAYDVGLCRMLIAPVELDGSWSCYAWDFMEKRLNILDPLLRRSRSGIKEEAIKMKHSSVAPQLLSALLVCVSLYCNSHGYDHQESSPNGWKTEVLQDLDGMRSHPNNTGMYTLFYAREFDGKGLRQTVSQGTIASLRRDLLYQMLTMRGNTGRRPSIVDYPVTGPI